jgi:tRNA threonylcarbamoyl adenosine modification protein YeaZ
MNYLAIDTCDTALTVAVSYNGKTKVHYAPDCGVKHSVDLMPAVENIILELGFNLNDADFIAVVVGAGSFTGIRIGVSTVKALCFAFKKPCLAITSFDTLAYNNTDGKTLAVIDAKHGSFYACGYTDGKISFPPSFISRTQLDELLGEYTLVSGAPINGLDTKVVSVTDGLIKAVESKADEKTLNLDQVVPLYIRKSQAEENR